MPVRVVLVEPTHPGNIGAVARAMGNMNVSQLSLVQPVDYLVEEALVRAAGNERILHDAKVHDTLNEATADCNFIVATSARRRTTAWPSMQPGEAMQQVALISNQQKNVAIVFGPERSGLSNRDLDLCHLLVCIPSSEASPSINLAGAVLLILYELFLAQKDPLESEQDVIRFRGDFPATQEQIEGFFEHMWNVLDDIEFVENKPHDTLKRKIRRIFLRPGLTVDDVNILRGILTAVSKHINRIIRKKD